VLEMLELVPLDNAEEHAARAPEAAQYLIAYYNGYICGIAGEVEKALGLFREAISSKPDFAKAHFNVGVTLGMLNRSA
jgi:tetratricopeptide (TPR) repeat protein